MIRVRDLVAPAARDVAALLFAEPDRGGAHPAGEEAGEVRRVVVADASGDRGDRQVGGGEELLGAAEPDAEEVVLGAAARAPPYHRAQFGGCHAVPGRVFGDGQRLEGVAGEGLENRVAVGADIGAGPAQGDEEFVDGGTGLHLQQRVATPGRPHHPPHRGPGAGRVGERDERAVGLDVAEFGVRGGGGAGEVDEALVPAGAGVGAVVVRVPGVSQIRLGATTGTRRPSVPLNQPLPELMTTATWWSRVRGPTVGRAPCCRPTPRQTRPSRWWSGLGVKKRIQVWYIGRSSSPFIFIFIFIFIALVRTIVSKQQ